MRWLGIQIEQQSKLPQDDDPFEFMEPPRNSSGISQLEALSKQQNEDIEPSSTGVSDPSGSQREAVELATDLGKESERFLGIEGVSTSGLEESLQDNSVPRGDDSGGAGTQGLVIGDGLASPDSTFGRTWSIRWLQHLQGFGDRKKMGARAAGPKGRRHTTWVQSTGQLCS